MAVVQHKSMAVVQHESEAFIDQRWSQYTAEQHSTWSTLFARRMEHLAGVASNAFLDGMRAIGLDPATLPDVREVNARLKPRTGWTIVPVSGFLHPRLFFRCLAERRFPTTVTIRPPDRLDYIPEPDIFHDVFGHVPMHADQVFADFLQRFGELACRSQSEQELEEAGRLFWFTVEFGLIQEGSDTKVYGSGLISSHADCLNALGPDCERRPFSLEGVIAQSFDVHNIQPVLFIVRSFDELFVAVEELQRRRG
jgi:phenylalanine-4-hydroxylase